MGMFRIAFAAGAGALAVAGCSVSVGQTPTSAAEEAIEDELGGVLGLELSDATCGEPDSDDPGETFTCTATGPSGETVTVDAVVDPDDQVFVAASNVVIADDMAAIEQEAIEVLAPEVGLPVERIAVDCPVGPIVLDGDLLICEISDTSTGERFELEARLSEYVLREGYASRTYVVGVAIE